MGHSSRLFLLVLGLALPTATRAQVYGFPGAAGVIDDGFGTLPPPLPPPAFDPLDAPARSVPPPAASPPPCALIIQIGKGLRHKAASRVVYGHAPRCR